MDRKRVVITLPHDIGSEYFNYKNTFSIILLAIAGPDCESLFANIGSSSRMNDSGVWNNSGIRGKIENKELGIPEATPLPYGEVRVPYQGCHTISCSEV